MRRLHGPTSRTSSLLLSGSRALAAALKNTQKLIQPRRFLHVHTTISCNPSIQIFLAVYCPHILLNSTSRWHKKPKRTAPKRTPHPSIVSTLELLPSMRFSSSSTSSSRDDHFSPMSSAQFPVSSQNLSSKPLADPNTMRQQKL